jgi:hypothetical protein
MMMHLGFLFMFPDAQRPASPAPKFQLDEWKWASSRSSCITTPADGFDDESSAIAGRVHGRCWTSPSEYRQYEHL